MTSMVRAAFRRNQRRSAVGSAALADDVEAGRYYLPGSITGLRETIVTSPIEACRNICSGFPARLDAVAGGGLHCSLLHAADSQGRDLGADLRRARGCDDPVWMWGSDLKPLQGGGYRSRHQAADLCHRLAVAFLVGDDRAAAGRGLALSRLCVFLSLPLDGLAASSGRNRRRLRRSPPRPCRPCCLVAGSAMLVAAGRMPAPEVARQSHSRDVDRPRRRCAWPQRW